MIFKKNINIGARWCSGQAFGALNPATTVRIRAGLSILLLNIFKTIHIFQHILR